MVAEMRSTAETAAPVSAVSAAPQAEPAAEAGTPPEAEPAAEAEPGEPTTEEAFAPISVPAAEDEGSEAEPVPAAPVQLRRDSGDRSLRELFWGED
jgi:hypothetical protein